jgi:GNS1/SUR4 family
VSKICYKHKLLQPVEYLSSDPLIDSWFFMTTPLPMISLIMIYLWFIFKIGPEFMKHKKPFSLTWVIRLYNIFQVIACIAFIVKIHREGFSFKDTWKVSKLFLKVVFCSTIIFQCINEVEAKVEVSKKTMSAFSTVWWFLMLRFFEFIETVFFVLKKKQNQISTLHIYHHVSTGVLLWLFLKYSGGKIRFNVIDNLF